MTHSNAAWCQTDLSSTNFCYCCNCCQLIIIIVNTITPKQKLFDIRNCFNQIKSCSRQASRPSTYVVTRRRSPSPSHNPHLSRKTPMMSRSSSVHGTSIKTRPSPPIPSKAQITDLIDQHRLYDNQKARVDLMNFIKSYIRYCSWMLLLLKQQILFRKSTGQRRVQNSTNVL